MSLHVRHQFDWWFDRSLLSKRESLPCPVRPETVRPGQPSDRQLFSSSEADRLNRPPWSASLLPVFSSPRLTLNGNGNGSLDAYLPRYLMVNGGGGDCRLLTLEKISIFPIFLFGFFYSVSLELNWRPTVPRPWNLHFIRSSPANALLWLLGRKKKRHLE